MEKFIKNEKLLKLMRAAKMEGKVLTFTEINDCITEDVTPEEIEELLENLRKIGVKIADDTKPKRSSVKAISDENDRGVEESGADLVDVGDGIEE